MRSIGRSVLAATAVVALAGCPSSYGFRARVVSAKGARVRVVATEPTREATLEDVTPIPNARVTCDGCGDDAIRVEANGDVFVTLGTGWSSRPPLVLHVAAPGYRPMDVQVKEPPHDSQLGYALFVIVLAPER